MAQDAGHVTVLLRRLRDGDADAGALLYEQLHAELRLLAERLFRSQKRQHTLQPTALVNEAFLKMMRPGTPAWNDRAHFFAVSARAMRQVLVNHARDAAAAKRGGGAARQRVTLARVEGAAPEVEVLDVHAALEALAELDDRQARIAELRFFGGLTNREVAEALGVSLRTVELDWKMAKDWLARRLV